MFRNIRFALFLIAVYSLTGCASRHLPADYRKPPETYFMYVATNLEKENGALVLTVREWQNGAPIHVSTTPEMEPTYRAIARKHGPIFGFRGASKALDATTQLFIHGKPDPVPADGNQTLFEFTDISAGAQGTFLTMTPWYSTGKTLRVSFPADWLDAAKNRLGRIYKINRYQL